MSNLLNTQNANNNQELASVRIGKNSNSYRCIEAPESLPKYSIHKALQEKDEFRKNIYHNQNQELYPKKSNKFLKLGLVLAAVGSFFLFKGKK